MAQETGSPRIALAHDWLVGRRGGEMVLDRLARAYGPADLYVLVNDGRPISEAITACRVHTSALQRFPFAAGAWRRAYLPLMPWAVGSLRVAPCDLLISTSSAVMKAIHAPAGAAHLCYCHSPARYIWEQTDDYAVGRGGLVRGALLRAVRRRFQRWDLRTVPRVTRFLANSAHTAARIARCFGREAAVVHPPVRTTYFTPEPGASREDFLLVVSALEPYKRVDLAIAAAAQARRRLIVVGSGSQHAILARQARECGWAQMRGRVSDEELRDLYRTASALIFPQQEDFGIIAAEALACGCPVVAYAAGGAREIVNEESGVLFPEQSCAAIVAAIDEVGRRSIRAQDCRARAESFSEDRFDAAIAAHVRSLIGGGA